MVSHAHHMPPADAPDCSFCHDKGFHQWEGEWSFCRCPAGTEELLRDPKICDTMNAAMRKMEQKIKDAKR